MHSLTDQEQEADDDGDDRSGTQLQRGRVDGFADDFTRQSCEPIQTLTFKTHWIDVDAGATISAWFVCTGYREPGRHNKWSTVTGVTSKDVAFLA